MRKMELWQLYASRIPTRVVSHASSKSYRLHISTGLHLQHWPTPPRKQWFSITYIAIELQGYNAHGVLEIHSGFRESSSKCDSTLDKCVMWTIIYPYVCRCWILWARDSPLLRLSFICNYLYRRTFASTNIRLTGQWEEVSFRGFFLQTYYIVYFLALRFMGYVIAKIFWYHMQYVVILT